MTTWQRGFSPGIRSKLIEKHTVADELDQAVAMLMDARKAEISELDAMFAVSGCLLEGTYAGLAEQSYRVALDEVPYRMTVSFAQRMGSSSEQHQEMPYVGTVRSAFISWEAPFAFFMLTPESEYEEHAAAFASVYMEYGVDGSVCGGLSKSTGSDCEADSAKRQYEYVHGAGLLRKQCQ